MLTNRRLRARPSAVAIVSPTNGFQMDEPEAFGKLLDEVVADGVTLRAFMLQTTLELARLHPDGSAWAEEFILHLRARVTSTKALDQSAAIWELARTRIDTLGAHLQELLRPPRA